MTPPGHNGIPLRIPIWLVAIIVALYLAPADVAGAAPTGLATSTLVITVRDYTGRPLPHAYFSVQVNLDITEHFFADDSGRYATQVAADAPTSPVCASTVGTGLPYYSQACIANVIVAPGETKNVDLVLPPPPITPTPSAAPTTSSPTPSPSLPPPTPARTAMPRAAPSPCRFVLGFRELHDLLPSVVGDCLDEEAHNPANGDAVQHTTNGLLAWRKADNLAAFTDGYRTWVSGPIGVQERLNTQRFSWESNPDGLPVAP